MAREQIVPNFFIAGAPKCGTTALGEYLRAHPAVFRSYPNEPSYFADDLLPIHAVTTLQEYEALLRTGPTTISPLVRPRSGTCIHNTR